MHAKCWFDGACAPTNPSGYTTYGAVIRTDDGREWKLSKYLGIGPDYSNNVGEYAGLIAVLRFLKTLPDLESATIYGDSKLVVEQIKGRWRANAGRYLDWYDEALKLWREFPPGKLSISWVPREANFEADELSRAVIPQEGRADGNLLF
jgi:ribonuclease HI